jgi:hypothetical protein
MGFSPQQWTKVFTFFCIDLPEFSGYWAVTKAGFFDFFHSLCRCFDH